MYNHDHHKKIHHVLSHLDVSIFRESGAYFGGGTLITLLHGEYRWSKDIDFICPVGPGYKKLRKYVMEGAFKPHIFFLDQTSLEFPRDLSANQYGIRFLVMVDGEPIKFEIVAEARIQLDAPEDSDRIPVPYLNRVDRYAEKLLANADRWPDTSIEARDLIDLAVLRLYEGSSEEAICKAEEAYPVLAPLKKALQKFQNSTQFRDKCFTALQIKNRSTIIDGIDLLASDMGLGKTVREYNELSSIL